MIDQQTQIYLQQQLRSKVDFALFAQLRNGLSTSDSNLLDLTNYIQRTELNPYALKTSIPDLQPYAKTADLPSLAPYAKTVDLAPYAKTVDLPSLTPYAKTIDLAPYAKTADLPSLTSYAKTEDLPSLTPYAKTVDLAPYAKTADLPSLATYAKTTDLAPYALTANLPSLTPYALKTDLPSMSGYALQSELSTYALQSSLIELIGRVNTLEGSSFNASNYYTRTQADVAFPSKDSFDQLFTQINDTNTGVAVVGARNTTTNQEQAGQILGLSSRIDPAETFLQAWNYVPLGFKQKVESCYNYQQGTLNDFMQSWNAEGSGYRTKVDNTYTEVFTANNGLGTRISELAGLVDKNAGFTATINAGDIGTAPSTDTNITFYSTFLTSAKKKSLGAATLTVTLGWPDKGYDILPIITYANIVGGSITTSSNNDLYAPIVIYSTLTRTGVQILLEETSTVVQQMWLYCKFLPFSFT